MSIDNLGNGYGDAIQTDMRSLSLDELNANENLLSGREDDNQSVDENDKITFFLIVARLYFYLYKENDFEEEESEDYLPIDPGNIEYEENRTYIERKQSIDQY